MKTFLVVTPCYRQRHYLTRCMCSVLWQLQGKDQMIIDRGDMDVDGLEDYPAVAGGPYSFAPAATNRGIGASRNHIVAWACGADGDPNLWLKFLDADDVLAPYVLETFRQMEIPPEVMVVTGPQVKVHNGRLQTIGRKPDWSLMDRMNPTLPSMTFVRASAFQQVRGFATHIHFEEDWDFWLRLRQNFGMQAFATVGWPVCYYWISDKDRETRIRPDGHDHNVSLNGEQVDVREYLKQTYKIDPIR